MAKKLKKIRDDRRRNHIDRCERVFLPQERMRHIRWEESVALAQAKRKGLRGTKMIHRNCHCGSVECLGVPILFVWNKAKADWKIP
jgi:hypothetical protein